MAYKGRFKPKNYQKYLGDPTNIIYRSLWELKLMRRLDEHPEIIAWGSEEVIVPYRSPKDNRIHRYFPDFYIKQVKDGRVVETLIEVKPLIQTQRPKIPKSGRRSAKLLREVATYAVNRAKWDAAEHFCEMRGWEFKIMTEKELGIPDKY